MLFQLIADLNRRTAKRPSPQSSQNETVHSTILFICLFIYSFIYLFIVVILIHIPTHYCESFNFNPFDFEPGLLEPELDWTGTSVAPRSGISVILLSKWYPTTRCHFVFSRNFWECSKRINMNWIRFKQKLTSRNNDFPAEINICVYTYLKTNYEKYALKNPSSGRLLLWRQSRSPALSRSIVLTASHLLGR